MPEKTAIKTNNYAIMPVSAILSFATVVLILLKALGVISVSWLIVFSPVIIWIGLVSAAALVFVTVVSLVALIQIWR